MQQSVTTTIHGEGDGGFIRIVGEAMTNRKGVLNYKGGRWNIRRNKKNKGDRSLLGKVFSKQKIGKEIIGSTMAKVWKVSNQHHF